MEESAVYAGLESAFVGTSSAIHRIEMMKALRLCFLIGGRDGSAGGLVEAPEYK
jgi:hypothetical protein